MKQIIFTHKYLFIFNKNFFQYNHTCLAITKFYSNYWNKDLNIFVQGQLLQNFFRQIYRFVW
jgi:hypothetical protein